MHPRWEQLFGDAKTFNQIVDTSERFSTLRFPSYSYVPFVVNRQDAPRFYILPPGQIEGTALPGANRRVDSTKLSASAGFTNLVVPAKGNHGNWGVSRRYWGSVPSFADTN